MNRFLKSYNNFINEKLSERQESYLSKIKKYVEKNSQHKLYPYSEDFIVKKKDSGEELIGKLFLIPEKKAIRFNFDEKRIVSIDLWKNLEFNTENIINNPDITMTVEGGISSISKGIIDFINDDIKITEDQQDEEKFKKAEDEEVDLNSFDKAILEEDIDVFEAIKYYTAQVAYGISNSLVVSGAAGLGKTTEVENILNELRVEFIPVSGDITTSGLYEILFQNRDKLLVFDDMDSVYKSEESINILKAVLDTKKKRKVSRILKSHFDSFNMSDEEIQEKYEETGTLPKQFEFTGRVIFITNKPGDEINPALISRSLFVDLNPGFDEVIDRINKIKPKIKPNISSDIKNEVVDFMIFMAKNYELKFPLNLRTFIHCLNIRISNDFKIGRVPIWQKLIKNYLTK